MVKRIKTGIPGFDKVIQGGFIENSVNLLSGGPGTGKTIFSLQFILNGAKLYNEKGLYISFQETEEELKADLAGFGLNFDGLSHKVKFIYLPLYSVVNFSSLLSNEVASFKPKRIVIDSISALTMPMEDDFERRKQVYKIRESLKSMNYTSIITSELANESGTFSESMGATSNLGGEEQFLSDSFIVLYYAGIGGESDRAINVVKMRRTNHLRGPVPMQIGKTGLKVLKANF